MRGIICGIICVILGGCTGVAGVVADKALSGELTDAAVTRIGTRIDAALARIDELQAEIDEKQARIARAKCLIFPAMKRYARRSEKHRLSIERDCGISFDRVIAVEKAGN